MPTDNDGRPDKGDPSDRGPVHEIARQSIVVYRKDGVVRQSIVCIMTNAQV